MLALGAVLTFLCPTVLCKQAAMISKMSMCSWVMVSGVCWDGCFARRRVQAESTLFVYFRRKECSCSR